MDVGCEQIILDPGRYLLPSKSQTPVIDSCVVAFQTFERHHFRMKQIWINKTGSFEEVHLFEVEYDMGLSKEVRIETVQLLREMHFITAGLKFREDRKGLRRVLNIILQT